MHVQEAMQYLRNVARDCQTLAQRWDVGPYEALRARQDAEALESAATDLERYLIKTDRA